MTTDWDVVGYVISSEHRTAVMGRLAEGQRRRRRSPTASASPLHTSLGRSEPSGNVVWSTCSSPKSGGRGESTGSPRPAEKSGSSSRARDSPNNRSIGSPQRARRHASLRLKSRVEITRRRGRRHGSSMKSLHPETRLAETVRPDITIRVPFRGTIACDANSLQSSSLSPH